MSNNERGDRGAIRRAFEAHLPEQPPDFFVSDGAVYAHDRRFVVDLLHALLRYDRPITSALFYMEVDEAQLRRNFETIRASIFANDGDEGVHRNNLQEFVLMARPDTSDFRSVQAPRAIEEYLFDEAQGLGIEAAWYHSFDFPRFKVKGLTDSPAEWRALEQHLPSLSGKTLLDVGCNQGYFSIRSAEAGANVTGIDIDPSAIVVAGMIRDQVLSPDRARMTRFEVFDLAALKTRPMVDVVLCFSVLHHVPLLQTIADIAAATREVAFIEALVDRTLTGEMPLLALSDNPYVQEVLPSPFAFEKILNRHFRLVSILNPGSDRLMAKCQK